MPPQRDRATADDEVTGGAIILPLPYFLQKPYNSAGWVEIFIIKAYQCVFHGQSK